MLILARKLNERIRIGPDITVTIVEVRPDCVRLGIDAPPTVKILRSELVGVREKTKTGKHGLERPTH